MMRGYPESINTHDELLQAYTALFLFLGSSVSLTPAESGLPHLCESGLLRNLPVGSTNKRFEQASRMLRSPCPLKSQCRMAISENYMMLLGDGSSSRGAFPAASHWRDDGLTEEDHHKRLCAIYNRYGYSLADKFDLTPDHLGIQLLFANQLIEKYLTEDDDEIKAMIGAELAGFIANEMLSWLPGWSEAVTGMSKTKCYTAISGLIIGSLEDVYDIIVGDQKLGL